MKRDRFQDRGRRYRLHYLAGHSELFGDPCKPETPTQKWLREETQRAGGLPKPERRVQHERLEMQKLALLIDYGRGENGKAPWWSPGFERWEAATWDDGHTLQQWREGARPGWPDCGLFVPAYVPIKSGWNPGAQHIICAVCEMKKPADRPRGGMPPQWWLLDWGSRGEKSWHGLKRQQWAKLRALHACGFATRVAYSADEAFEWFDRLAGPRPEVLPW